MRNGETFETFIQRKQAQYGDKFDASNLAPQFVPYFNSRQRVRVRFSHGEEMTGRIGVTTGWRPCFLLMRYATSMGSPWTLEAGDSVIAEQVREGGPYREVTR